MALSVGSQATGLTTGVQFPVELGNLSLSPADRPAQGASPNPVYWVMVALKWGRKANRT
jgi:hypothetical protein